MKIRIRGKNLTVTEADRTYVERKLGKLDRVLDDRSTAEVELRLERRGGTADSHVVEVTLLIDGRTLRGSASAPTFHAATDMVVDRLERRSVEHKQRPRTRARSAPMPDLAIGSETAADDGDDDPEARAVVKIKRFAIEPMFEEDAISRMEDLGHAFFIFVDAETERVAVLYRRRDGRYGLIEPTVGGSYGATA